MSVIVIVLSFGLLGIILGVAYWFARQEQETINTIPPEEEMDEKERQHDARPLLTASSLCHEGSVQRSNSGSLAMLAAIRRACRIEIPHRTAGFTNNRGSARRAPQLCRGFG
jgi:hypothetical protein